MSKAAAAFFLVGRLTGLVDPVAGARAVWKPSSEPPASRGEPTSVSAEKSYASEKVIDSEVTWRIWSASRRGQEPG